MFSCFGNVEEKKPWKGVASAFKKKLRNIKKSKEPISSTVYNNQVSCSRNLAINQHRLEHFRQCCERYYDHRHHPGGLHIGAKAPSASKYGAVRSGLININGGGGHGFDLSEEVDVRAEEEFIKNMKMSWSLEKQQSTDSIDSISSQ